MAQGIWKRYSNKIIYTGTQPMDSKTISGTVNGSIVNLSVNVYTGYNIVENFPVGSNQVYNVESGQILSKYLVVDGSVYKPNSYYKDTDTTVIVNCTRVYYAQPTGSRIGDYITDVTAEAGTYPTNGKHSDGYWYVYQGLVNTAPTAPISITTPTTTQRDGTSVPVSWGTSTDAEGNALTYYLEFYDGSTWVACGNTTTKSLNYTLPAVNTSTAQFRVRAFDGKLYSTYTTSGTFTVFTNKAPTISGSANENLGNKNTPFTVTYSVNDVDSNNILNVVEKLNGVQINSISNAPRNTDFHIPFDRGTLDSLPLNKVNTIQIIVSDGLTTTYKNITFVRINLGPIISNIDKDLGEITSISEKYTCTDVEGNAFTITEKLDSQILQTFNGVYGHEYIAAIPLNKWFALQNGVHTFTVTAIDTLGGTTVRTFTFTKNETIIESTGLTNIIETTIAATKILLTPNYKGQANGNLLFEVCNNAFDVNPTWEDATGQTVINKPYIFINKVKTGTKWGIDIRFKISLKEGATGGIDFYGLGGSFE